jgi:ferredoxin--NADP+ reductase
MVARMVPNDPRHVVVIVGGAVAGSEAAALCAERGILAVVLEQNDRPYGKIEDGLPRWHDKLRKKEYEHIDANLARDNVLYVPRARLGEQVSLEQLRERWGANAVLLASGAWRDRLLFPDADKHLGRGLVNQNALVYWYNHVHEQGYQGPRFELEDDAIVVGGGLASIDVVKIINFELYKRAFARQGVRVTTLDIEHDGLPALMKQHGLTREQLGVRGVTLYYRREKTAMPLASPPENATAQQLEKTSQVRAKLMDKVIEKYLVRFEPNHAPLGPLLDAQGRMVGLRFQRTRTVEGKLVNVEDGVVEVRAPMVVSSIGSVPVPTPGLPMKGELIDFEDWTTGRVRGLPHVFGLGNVLTGKGNIKESRKNAQDIGFQLVKDYLGLGNEDELNLDAAHAAAREAAEAAVRDAESQPLVPRNRIAMLREDIGTLWKQSGYDGDYTAWMQRVRPVGEES